MPLKDEKGKRGFSKKESRLHTYGWWELLETSPQLRHTPSPLTTALGGGGCLFATGTSGNTEETNQNNGSTASGPEKPGFMRRPAPGGPRHPGLILPLPPLPALIWWSPSPTQGTSPL